MQAPPAINTGLTIYKHITSCRRERAHNPVELLRQLHLAAQPTRIGEPKRHVEHVVLVVVRLRQKVVKFLGEDNMTCRACHGTFAGAWRPITNPRSERTGRVK